MDHLTSVAVIVIVVAVIIIFGMLALFSRFYKKVEQGKVIVRNGVGGPVVSFGGIIVIPILHFAEIMDISVKRV